MKPLARPADIVLLHWVISLLAALLPLSITVKCFAAPDVDPAVIEILDRARLWEARNRLDLARQALEKLFRIASDYPDALAVLAEIELRSGQRDAAQQALNRLRRAQANHPGIARLQTLLRLGGVDKNKLRAAHLLAKTGKTDAAVAALRALYPDGPPSGDLALEYWQLVASTASGWEVARAGLTKLVQQYPDNHDYRLALAEHETAKISLAPRALRDVIELTRIPAHARQAQAVWRRAMMRLDAVPANIPLLREYLAKNPADTAVQERLTEITQAVQEQRRLPAEPVHRPQAEAVEEHRSTTDPRSVAKQEALALLDSQDLAGAEQRLENYLSSWPNDADAVGGMGLIRLRQGQHNEARTDFLRALELDPTNRDKWTSLARTARFWGLLHESGDARNAREFALAEQKVREALALDPNEPEALVGLARVQADQARVKEAEDTYRQALKLAPTNGAALRALIALQLSTGNREGAEQMIADLTPAQRASLADHLPSLRADMLRDDADRLVAAERLDEAQATLTRAVELDGTDPWLRYDLALLYARKGDIAGGRELLQEQLRKRPNDADLLHAFALFQSKHDADLPALVTLEKIPQAERSDNIVRLQRRVWTQVQLQRAEALAKAGMTAAAKEVMLETESGVTGDIDLTTSVALAWAELGNLARARELLDHLKTQGTALPPAWHLRYAALLDQSGADGELPGVLDEIGALPELTATDIEALRELRLSLALRTAESLRKQGKLDAALQRVRDVTGAGPGQARVLYAEARLLRTLRQPVAAQANYRRILSLNPRDDDAYLALIDTLIEIGNRVEARRLIDARLRRLTPQQSAEVETQVKLAGALIDLKDYKVARRHLEAVLAVASDHPQALAYLSDLARREGQLDLALRYLQRSQALKMAARAKQGPLPEMSRLVQLPLQMSAGKAQWSSGPMAKLAIDPAPPEAVAAERTGSGTFRTSAELLDQNTPWVSTAIDWRFRSGNGATSELDAKEIPVEVKMPWNDRGRLVFRTDFVTLNAGTLDFSNTAEARSFGSMLLCQPACSTGSISPSETGLSLNAGLERQGLRLDVGTTPLGFPVQSIVGGVLHKGDLGPFSYSVDASRRPITSTLLSYAGIHDPRTGAVWGGVRATGVRLGLSHDRGGAFGAWSSLGFHRLTGENVQPNNRMQFMGGGYWRLVNEEDRLLSIGMTGMLWRFDENAGEYTFGHGGYYSPQSYKSASLSLAFGERKNRFSYLLRGAVSISHSRFDIAPFYPTDPSMQAQAEALSSVNGVDPHYDGGGTGHGYSLMATMEYQLLPQLFVGARLAIERSPYYSPNRALAYVRYAFDQAAARPVPLPPEPVMPTSEF